MKKHKVSRPGRETGGDDALAVRLENAGMWRRAVARWSVVLADIQDEKESARIRQRQKWCLSQINIPVPEKPDYAGVLEAANGTLREMGLQLAAGDLFGRSGYKKER